ncbi:MAG: N-acetylmuramoyl-L-alanine amidase [bacterium]
MQHYTILISLIITRLALSSCSPVIQTTRTPEENRRVIIVYQPSHQMDTGREFNEAMVCNAIIESAIASSTGSVEVHKVWSHDQEGLHHARQGSNTKIEHTSMIDSLGRISGYAYELRASNKLKPDVFIGVHNNGATNKNACWGFVHEGDRHEQDCRELAKVLVDEICAATGMENGGILGDSSPNRNDYRCKTTGKLSFYSLDENVNTAPIRVLLEIGDNELSRELLHNPAAQQTMGRVIQSVIERRYGSEK